jgi:hypothetical protein
MTNAVVQVYISTENQQLLPKFDELSIHSQAQARAYAQRIGADYHLVTEPVVNYLHPTYERFMLIEDPTWTARYEQVLYLDSDIFIKPSAPNIFLEYADTTTFKLCRHWTKPPPAFNAGVFMVNRASQTVMAPYLNFREHAPLPHHDGSVLGSVLERSGVAVTWMDSRYNAKNSVDSYFCHTWGTLKHTNPVHELFSVVKSWTPV